MKISNKYQCDNNRQWIDDYGSDQWNNGRANEKNKHRLLQTEEDVEGVSGGGFVWSHCMIEKNEVSAVFGYIRLLRLRRNETGISIEHT